jgi:hypothetical protein
MKFSAGAAPMIGTGAPKHQPYPKVSVRSNDFLEFFNKPYLETFQINPIGTTNT